MSAPDPVLVERMERALVERKNANGHELIGDVDTCRDVAIKVAEVHAAEQVTAAVKAERQRILDTFIREADPSFDGIWKEACDLLRAIVNGGDT